MLLLYSPRADARLSYAAGMLGRLLGVPIQLAEPVLQADSPALAYDCEVAGALCLPHSPTLSAGSYQAPATDDVLGQIFWLLAEPWAYRPDVTTDHHGRPVPQAIPAEPVLHRLAHALASRLQRLWPGWQPVPMQADYAITYDIDHPWAWAHRPLWHRIATALRDTIRLRLPELKARFAPTDPFDPLPLLAQWPAHCLHTYWLLGGTTRFDALQRLTHPHVYQLLEQVRGRGISVGLHPSYATATDAMVLQKEVAEWQLLMGSLPTATRQHYLRWQYPATPRALLAAGIVADATAGHWGTAGFRHGIAIPFPWYDVQAETETPLFRYPFHAMDRSLLQAGLSPAQALEVVREQYAQVCRWGGTYTLLLHNQAHAGLYEWRGWQAFHRGMREMFFGDA